MIRSIQFKRRTQSSAAIPKPHHKLRGDLETQYDWQTRKPLSEAVN